MTGKTHRKEKEGEEEGSWDRWRKRKRRGQTTIKVKERKGMEEKERKG